MNSDLGEKMVEDGLVTVKEASEFLAVSRSHLYQLMDKGKLHWVKLGSSRRIPRRAMTTLAQANLKGGWELNEAL